MGRKGKKYDEIRAKAPSGVVELEAAVEFMKANPGAKFDETVEIAFRLGVDPKKSENAVRGSVNLPHGTGKDVTVVVFASGAAADAAREAGADHVGMDDLIEKIKGGWTGFDVAIATPDAMKEVRKLGRVLGPRGLMPNPKTGTVTEDTAGAVGLSKAGKVDFRMDRHGNINVPVGKLSFDADKIVENTNAVVAAVKSERPAGARGTYICNCTMCSTMGVGVAVSVRD